jgi:hypothetical protein
LNGGPEITALLIMQLHRRRIILITFTGHRLTTTRLVRRILDRHAQPLEQLKGCDTYFGGNGVYITGNKKTNRLWHNW